MPGAVSATLQGWVLPLSGAPYGEHTYVTSSCGFAWGCWGRSAGGASICSASGNSLIADCLSQPNSRAGIRYLVTGVCHQTANRILYPANITVAGTQGYNLSVFTYGEYGARRRTWPQLRTCCPPGTVFAGVAPTPLLPLSGGNHLVTANVVRSTADATVAAEEGSNVAEFLALAEKALGHRLEEPDSIRLMEIQQSLHRDQDHLVEMLDADLLTPEEYVEDLNTVLRRAMAECLAALGEERFLRIFGPAGMMPEGLGDVSTFLAAEADRRAQR